MGQVVKHSDHRCGGGCRSNVVLFNCMTCTAKNVVVFDQCKAQGRLVAGDLEKDIFLSRNESSIGDSAVFHQNDASMRPCQRRDLELW